VFSSNNTGVLSVAYAWPTPTRIKTVYFLKTKNEALTKDSTVKNHLVYGDMSYTPIDQLSAFVVQVSDRLQPAAHCL